jgi:hypothetical protein
VLDWKRKYDLTGSFGYRTQPHIEFLNVKSDDDLTSFVRRRGPLWGAYRKGHEETKVVGGKSRYWAFHRSLKAKLHLAAAFRSGQKSELADAILECMAADDERRELASNRSSEDWEETGLEALAFSLWERHNRKPELGLKEWIRDEASVPHLQCMAGWCVERFSVSQAPRTACRRGHGEIPDWRLQVSTLAEATELMFRQSTVGRRPLTFCIECGRAFLPESAHARRYCETPCARRAVVRAWRKRQKTNRRRGGRVR